MGALAGLVLLVVGVALDLSSQAVPRSLGATLQEPMTAALLIAPVMGVALGWAVATYRLHREAEIAVWRERLEEEVAALIQREWAMRAVLQNAFDGVLIVAGDGEVIDANPAAAKVFGVEVDRLVGMQVGELVLDREALATAAAVERRTAGGDVLGCEYHVRGRHADGTTFPVDLQYTVLSDPVLEVYCLREATSRVDAEEQRVRAAVQTAQDRAGLRNRERGDHLLELSRSLRDRLDALLARAEGPELRAVAIDMLVELHHLENLSVSERTARAGTTEPVDVRELLERVRAAVGPLAEHRGTELVFDTAADLSVITTEPLRLYHTLRNLALNALQATHGGTVRVDAAMEPGRGTSWAAFHVSDSGRGLSSAQREELFEMFAGRGRDAAGSSPVGLGLLMSQRFAKALGGHIAVRSEEGEGSTFTLRLPLHAEALRAIHDEPMRRLDSDLLGARETPERV